MFCICCILYFILHISYLQYVFAYVAYFCICCIFLRSDTQHAGLIDSEDDEPAQDIQEQPIEAGPPDDAPEDDLAVPVPPPGAAAPRHVPDMRTVMQRTGGPNHEDMLRELDDHMGQGNSGFPSERCGGGARRLLLKRNASQMSRSLSETFAYLTSKTASTQEAADVLQTFANVGLVFCSCS
jgi:hypothetical protein